MIERRHLQADSGLLILIAIATLILVGVVGYVWWQNTGGEKARMESHLEQKYGKKFLIKGVLDNSAGIGSKAYKATAHPLDDSSVEFIINHSVSSSKYSDDYLRVLWTKEHSKELEQAINSLQEKSNSLNTSITITPDDRLTQQYLAKVLSYDEAIKQSDRNISLGIRLNEHSLYTKEVAKKNADYINRVIESFSQNDAYVLRITYIGQTTDDGEDYSCYLSNITTVQPIEELISCTSPKR